MAAAKDDTTQDQEVQTKPSKVEPAATSGITLDSLREDYANGLPLHPLDPQHDRAIPLTEAQIKAREDAGQPVNRPVSPQEIADYRNVDVYWVLKAVDPDHRIDPMIEGEQV